MFSKKILPIVVMLMIVAFVLPACASTPSPEEPTNVPTVKGPTAVEEPKELNVAAILSVGLESTWDSTFYEAYQRIQKQSPHGVKINDLVYTEGAWGEEAETVLRQYAETGKYDIIFAQASFTDQIKNLMDEYPDILWVTAGSGNEFLGKNSYVIYMRIFEPSYLEGMLAGLTTKTNIVGVIGLFPADDVNDDANAFIAGAKSVNPDVKAKVTFIETWYDPAKAQEATKAQIAAGADNILQGGEVYDVCTEAGIYCYGRYADVSPMAPKAILASALGYWDPAINYIIDQWWDHKTTGEPYNAPKEAVWFPMAQSGSDIFINPDLKDQLPPGVIEQVEKAREDILSGKLIVPLNVETPKSD